MIPTVRPSDHQTIRPSNRSHLLSKFLFLILLCGFSDSLIAQNWFCNTTNHSSSWLRASNCSQFDMTTDELRCLPDITINLAFHFEADANEVNFTCNPNDPVPAPSWYAPTLTQFIIDRMNQHFSSALLYNGQAEDSKIRFQLVGDGSCGTALFTYSHNQPFNDVPNAMNVHFKSNKLTDLNLGGYVAFFGSDVIVMENIINHWVVNDRRWWDVAITMMHEFGHTRNLKHTFDCANVCDTHGFYVAQECCGSCQDGNPASGANCWQSCSPLGLFMSDSASSSPKMVECEFEELWNYMINHPEAFQEFETCDLPPSNDKIVYDENSAIVWDVKKIFTKHVVIKSGTTVTVNCEVMMGDDKEIVVEDGAKLIVDGGTITSICEKPWRGIKAYGGSDSFAVEIKGGSTLENTSQGAVSMFHDGGWLLGSGNAHVLIQGSTFTDCNRILALGSINANANLSIVDNNIQNGGKYSVTNWNCLNVQVINNEFNAIENSCIVTDGGQFNIEGNTFNSYVNDILFASISPTVRSVIFNNDFEGIGVGLRMQGTSVAQHLIKFNRFNSSNSTNIRMEGDNHYIIDDNDLDGNIGGVILNNGSHRNVVINNNVYTGNYGLGIFGQNNGFVLNRNCYQTDLVDNYIAGEIGSVQGAVGPTGAVLLLPANNCFTHQGAISSPVEDLFGFPNEILYIEPMDNIDDCRDAVKADPNITSIEFKETPVEPCPDDDDGIGDPCNPIKEMAVVSQSLNQLEDVLSNMSKSSIEYEPYVRCYESVRSLWMELMLEQGEFDQVRTHLEEVQNDDAKILIYKTYLMENKFSSAQQYLSSLINNSEQLTDFITLQSINLKRFTNNAGYEVSDSELSEIFSIANKDHPYSTYGKSLYFWLTGELISSELPPFFRDFNTQERSVAINDDNVIDINIYPNPFSKKLNVEIQNATNSNLEIVIDDILGRRFFEQKDVVDNLDINTSSWNEGVYIVHIYKTDKLLEIRKLILSK